MCPPNLFYHTGELSQDAFLAWLLRWAHPATNQHDNNMHAVGVSFLQRLLQTYGQTYDGTSSVEVRRQYKNIDLLVVTEKHVLLIEDKVHSKDHSGQLARYRGTIQNEAELNGKTLCPIFLKTGSQATYKNIEEAGYKLFLRNNMLSFLQEKTNHNIILKEFYNHLRRMEENEQSFSTTSPDKWDYDAWIGFYQTLQNDENHFPDLDWDYVNNRSGGFAGCWWGAQEWRGAEVYLQLQQNKLCFKISIEEVTFEQAGARDLRKNWKNLILQQAKEKRLPIKAPTKMGYGRTMTCGIVERSDWMATTTQNLIDIKETINKLSSYTTLCRAAANNNPP